MWAPEPIGRLTQPLRMRQSRHMRDELSPSEAARRIGATTRSVQRWIALGKLPARRVGGRWRVASDALDAFASTPSASRCTHRHRRPTTIVASDPIRRLFVANRGEIARRIRRTAERLGIDVDRAADRRRRKRSTCSTSMPSSRPPRRRRRRAPPGLRLPRRERRRSPRRSRRRASRWVGPPPERDPGDGRQGGRAPARQSSSACRSSPATTAPTSRTRRSRRPAKRIGYPLLVKPAAGGGGKGMRVVRDPASTSPTRSRAPAARPRRLRRRPADPRALRRGPAPRRGPGPVRRPRQRHPPRRARLLDPAPPPEGPRGDAVARRRRRRSASGSTPHALRLAGAVGYRSAGTCEFLLDRPRRGLLPRDEHAPPGRAPGDRARDRPSTSSSSSSGSPRADRSRSTQAADRRRARRAAATRSRSASTPRTPRTASCPRPGGSSGCAGRPARASGSTPASTRATIVGARFDPMLAKVIAHGPDRARRSSG